MKVTYPHKFYTIYKYVNGERIEIESFVVPQYMNGVEKFAICIIEHHLMKEKGVCGWLYTSEHKQKLSEMWQSDFGFNYSVQTIEGVEYTLMDRGGCQPEF